MAVARVDQACRSVAQWETGRSKQAGMKGGGQGGRKGGIEVTCEIGTQQNRRWDVLGSTACYCNLAYAAAASTFHRFEHQLRRRVGACELNRAAQIERGLRAWDRAQASLASSDYSRYFYSYSAALATAVSAAFLNETVQKKIARMAVGLCVLICSRLYEYVKIGMLYNRFPPA